MDKKRFISFFCFLTIIMMTFVLPMYPVQGIKGYWLMSVIVSTFLTLFLYTYHFSLFIPTLFFTANFILRPCIFSLIKFCGSYTKGLQSLPAFVFIFPILGYIFFLISCKKAKQEAHWFAFGKIDTRTWWLIIISSILTIMALVSWVFIAKQDVSAFTKNIPKVSIGVLFLGGILFSLLNAFVEEFLARAVLWDGFDCIFSHVLPTLIFHALFFGAWHYYGIPGGPVGVILVFIWSLFLGILRYRTKGMLAPIIVHFIADFTIFILLFLKM